MIGKLWLYFGVIGIFSILAWVAALFLFARYGRHARRSQRYWLALALAVAGLLGAKINSHFIGGLAVDRSEEHGKAIERQKQMRRELEAELGKKAAKVRFAEDSPTDALDMAGVNVSGMDPYAAAAMPEDPDQKYAYRKRGKQQREVSAAAATGMTVVAGSAPVVKAKEARQLPERDYNNAHRLDRLNLFFARLTFWLALLLVAWDYLTRFNLTFRHLWPLPISHRQIDELWPKTRSVWWRGARLDEVTRYLRHVVRKNENFIYFGERDPFPTMSDLPRVKWRQWSIWPLRLLRATGYEDEWLWESAWFHRLGILITGRTEAEQRVTGLVRFLTERHETRAHARRTVHVVWDFPTVPAEATLRQLEELCRTANFKLVVTAPVAPPIFEEVCAPA